MTTKKKIGGVRRKVRPRILIALRAGKPFVDIITDMARVWGWNLLDYGLVSDAYLNEAPPSGAIVDHLPDGPLVTHLHKIGCPVVRLGSNMHPMDDTLPAILPDIEATGHLAAMHFLERDFTNAAFIGWNPTCSHAVFHRLYHSYKDTLEQAGASLHTYSMVDSFKKNETPETRLARNQKQLGNWMLDLPKPIGILGFDDKIMAQLCVFFQLRGGHVPEEVALLGYGNSSWCNRSPVALSSIAPGYQEHARRAMELLRSLMEGASAPKEPILIPPAGLIKRRSTDILAMTDILVAQALLFIWEHIDENISVADVAHSVGLSERQLGRRFQQAIGRSVNQEIVRRRLETVKSLLQTSSGSIAEIASLTGYRSARYLHFAFQKAVGMTPGAYRKKHAA